MIVILRMIVHGPMMGGRMQGALSFDQELRRLLLAAGWHVERPNRRDVDIDFIAEHPPHRYAIEIKVAKESRRQLLEGLLASAILRATAAADAVSAKPLAIVCAPLISSAALKELGDFAARYGGGVAWGAADASGLAVFHAAGLGALSRRSGSSPKAPPGRSHHDFLSDLGQWMLKVVLSHQLPEELRMYSRSDQGEIDGLIWSANELSRVANVSIPSASRFLASLRQERFAGEGFPVRLIRVSELLARWRAVHQKRPREIRARWLFPRKDPRRHLDDVLRHWTQERGKRACLGLFSACDRLGLSFVSGVAPHLYLETASIDNFHALGLRSAEPGESADVFVCEPRFPESVFRGARRRDDVPVADLLQCWLDVSNHPARGEEMAAHIYDRILVPDVIGGE